MGKSENQSGFARRNNDNNNTTTNDEKGRGQGSSPGSPTRPLEAAQRKFEGGKDERPINIKLTAETSFSQLLNI